MSNVIFEGNTYVFGATVSAILGTGTTNYIFTGLVPNTNYGFIIWAFNSGGTSGIVGPVTIFTLSEEQREPVLVFSYGYIGDVLTVNNYPNFSQQNSLNLISPSQASPSTKTPLFSQFDTTTTGNITQTKGILDPFGGTNAVKFNIIPGTTGTFVSSNVIKDNSRIPITAGITYIFSVWHDITNGDTGNGWLIRGYTNTTTSTNVALAGRQILPVTGSFASQPAYTYPSTGYSGWVRFAFEFQATGGNSYAVVTMISRNRTNPNGHTMYFFGAQLEEATGTGPTGYMPNVYDGYIYSGNCYSATGATLYDSTIQNVVNWSVDNGFTYYWPHLDLRPDFTLNDFYNRDVFDDAKTFRAAEILKNLPANKRAFRLEPLDNNEVHDFYEDALNGISWYTGVTATYYNNDFSTRTSLTGFIGTLWPQKGISASYELWTKFLTKFASHGATMDYIFWDNEFIPFSASSLEKTESALGWTAAKYIAEDSRYSQTFNGVTSLQAMMSDLGATLINLPGPYYGEINSLNWQRVVSKHILKARELASLNSTKQIFPNAIVSNYNTFSQLDGVLDGAVDGNGWPGPENSSYGNISSPVLYGGAAQVRDTYLPRNDPTTTGRAKYIGSKNIIRESEDFGNTSYWNKTNSSILYGPTFVNDPYGQNNACIFSDGNTANAVHSVGFVGDTVSGLTSQFAVGSFFLKKPDTNGLTFAAVRINIGGVRFGAVFDLINGTTGASNISGGTMTGTAYGITSAGNSWYRCWVSCQIPSTSTSYFLTLCGSNSLSPSIWFQSHPQYSANNNDLYCFGAQIEQSVTNEPTSYSSRVQGYSIANLPLPWTSFMLTMNNLRSAKRGNPNIPLTPWISDVGYIGDINFNATYARPIVGFSDTKVGYNERYGITFSTEAGNSAYYYEMVRHCILNGSKALPLWTGMWLRDVRAGQNKLRYYVEGFTGYLTEIENLNSAVADVHSKIGGFTLATADTNLPNWLSSYFASGAPDAKGITWWWRITLNPQYNLLVNGLTLSGSSGPYGTWVSTTGPTLAHVPITVIS